MHSKWTRLLQSMATGRPGAVKAPGYGVSHEMLAEVLTRAALAPEPTSRSEISKGSMLIEAPVLASGTVGKAADALIGAGFLTELPPRRGLGGPPITPLALDNTRWATMGFHVDLEQDEADMVTGVICGLNREMLAAPETEMVAQAGDEHDLLGLAKAIRRLAERLLAGVAAPPGEVPARELLGVGVELGGHVFRGVVVDSVYARLGREADLGKTLIGELEEVAGLEDVPVVVENDVNALAIHGYWAGSFEGPDTAVVAVFRLGVGGALILNHHMYRGIRGMAPEPGHLAVEYPEDWASAKRRPLRNPGKAPAFDDECMCSIDGHKFYGHVDTLATPGRIEGQLAALKPDAKIRLEEAAAASRAVPTEDPDQEIVSEEAKVMRRAGQGLGRGLAHMVNILNPGELVVFLPAPLATPAPMSSGTVYIEAAERELNTAYSTAPSDARGGHARLTVHGYKDDDIAQQGAIAAATTAFNAFIEHAHGRDGCQPLVPGSAKDRRRGRPR